jgi:hypothetical protein
MYYTYKYVYVHLYMHTYFMSDCDGHTAGTEGEASSMFQEVGGSVLVETFERKIFRPPEVQPLCVLFSILPG